MSTSASSPAYCHSSGLDVLRILLCVCVIHCHFVGNSLTGHVAVLGFFLLSGYLLQASFSRMKVFDVERFYASRARRLLPIYLLSVAITFLPRMVMVCAGAAIKLPPLENEVFSFFEYAWFYNLPAWYMYCLFVFLLMAPVLWCLHRMRGGIALLFVLAFAFSSFLYWRHHGTPDVRLGMEGSMCPCPEVRLYQFLAGMLCYRMKHQLPLVVPRRLRSVLVAGALLLLAGAAVLISRYFNSGYAWPNAWWIDVPTIVLLGLIIVMWDDGRSFCNQRLRRCIAWLASLTYGVYMFHLFFHSCIRRGVNALMGFSLPLWLSMALALAASVVVTEAVNRGSAWWWKKRQQAGT